MASETCESEWTEVAQANALREAGRLVIEVGELELLLLWGAGRPVALHNRCSHLSFPLTEGRAMGGQISCPRHGACFDLTTGAAVSGPAVSPIQIYECRIGKHGGVEVRLSGVSTRS